MCHRMSHHFSGTKITRDLCLRSRFRHALQDYVSLITRWQFITLKWHGTLLYAYTYATENGSNFSEICKCPDTPFAPQFARLHLLLIFCTLLQVILIQKKNRIAILE